MTKYKAKFYFEDYLYDLQEDPIERYNRIKDPKYKKVRADLRKMLVREMVNAGEDAPKILPACVARKK